MRGVLLMQELEGTNGCRGKWPFAGCGLSATSDSCWSSCWGALAHAEEVAEPSVVIYRSLSDPGAEPRRPCSSVCSPRYSCCGSLFTLGAPSVFALLFELGTLQTNQPPLTVQTTSPFRRSSWPLATTWFFSPYTHWPALSVDSPAAPKGDRGAVVLTRLSIAATEQETSAMDRSLVGIPFPADSTLLPTGY